MLSKKKLHTYVVILTAIYLMFICRTTYLLSPFIIKLEYNGATYQQCLQENYCNIYKTNSEIINVQDTVSKSEILVFFQSKVITAVLYYPSTVLML
jgi:hypothetical protein